MRIGILTWYFASNYGARAHTYALRNIIENMGHVCEFVNFIPKEAFKVGIRSNINCANPRSHPVRLLECFIRCGMFHYTRKINICGEKIRKREDIDPQKYDLIVIGSDAILNIYHPLFCSIYYGEGIIKTPYCFYAPSCEYMEPSAELYEPYITGIRNAIALSGRDERTVRMFAEVGCKKAELVLDPTMLIDFTSISQNIKESDYLLVYCFSDWEKYSKQIRDYANTENIKIISIGKYCTWADKSYGAISFYKWLGAFENAKAVFTDSYHGTIFALKNQKILLAVAREDKKYKIQDILEQMGRYNFQFYNGENVTDYLQRNIIDYDDVRMRLEFRKQTSINYLKYAINIAKDIQL